MSDTPETDIWEEDVHVVFQFIKEPEWKLIVPSYIARSLEIKLNEALKERDEARRELAETISCIEQAIDYHQVHNQYLQASAISNLLENISQRRKHDAR